MANIDIGGKKIFEFLKANYEVPENVIGFEIKGGVDCATEVTWITYLTEKDETENVTEPLKDLTEPTK